MAKAPQDQLKSTIEVTEELAEQITRVSQAAQRLFGSRLQKRAVLLLIKDACGGSIGLRDIDVVLTRATQLDKLYLKPAKRGGK